MSLFVALFAAQLQSVVASTSNVEGARRRLVLALALVAGCVPNHLSLLSLVSNWVLLDPAMFNFDQHLGIHLHTIGSAVVAKIPPLATSVDLIYKSVPLMIAAFDVVAVSNSRRLSMSVRFLVSGAIGFVLYHLCPVVGPPFFPIASVADRLAPDFLFPDGSVALNVLAPINCMPSLHSTWALLIFFSLGEIENRVARWGFMVVSALTLLGALTVGGHWPLDMAVSVPFALALQGLFDARGRAVACTALSAAIVAVWFAALRNFTFIAIDAAEAWLLILATILFPLAVSRYGAYPFPLSGRLHRADAVAVGDFCRPVGES